MSYYFLALWHHPCNVFHSFPFAWGEHPPRTFTLVRVRLSPWPETARAKGQLDRVAFSATESFTQDLPCPALLLLAIQFSYTSWLYYSSSVAFCQTVLKMDGELDASIPGSLYSTLLPKAHPWKGKIIYTLTAVLLLPFHLSSHWYLLSM